MLRQPENSIRIEPERERRRAGISAKSTCSDWQYRCIVTDENGSKVTSDAAKLTVR